MKTVYLLQVKTLKNDTFDVQQTLYKHKSFAVEILEHNFQAYTMEDNIRKTIPIKNDSFAIEFKNGNQVSFKILLMRIKNEKHDIFAPINKEEYLKLVQ